MFEGFGAALAQQVSPEFVLLLLIGTSIGLIAGILPGATLPTLALTLAFTYRMDPTAAAYLLCAIEGASTFGGSISSVLFNIPGEAVNTCTTFDGYPMARRGEAARALSICATTSLFGALIAICWLVLLLPVVRSSVLMVGPPEFFMMILFGLVVVVIANRANMLKGLVSAGIGVLLSFIGFSPLTGVSRFTFGSERYLWDGIGLIPFFVGVFAFGEIIRWGLQGAGGTIAPPERLQLGLKQVVAGVKDVFRYPVTLVRSSAIGMGIGIIPGVGGVISNFLAYTTAIQFSRTPQLFGTGNAEGLVASESSNNATTPGALLTTVAIGIPGSISMSILLGAFMSHGFNVGPLFIREHGNIVWLMIFALIGANCCASFFGLLAARALARLTMVRVSFIMPVALLVGAMGVFLYNNNIWDVFTAIAVGVLGYLLYRFSFPIISLVIGFILGHLAEQSFLQSLQMSLGSYSIFYTRPISLILFLLLVASFVLLPALHSFTHRGEK